MFPLLLFLFHAGLEPASLWLSSCSEFVLKSPQDGVQVRDVSAVHARAPRAAPRPASVCADVASPPASSLTARAREKQVALPPQDFTIKDQDLNQV